MSNIFVINLRRATALLAAAGALVLSGCNSGSTVAGAAPAATLSGVAATGAPIIGGTVTVTCSGGGPLTTTTATDGSWTVTISGQTLPCAASVTGGNLPGGTTYHALALSTGTVNITPLTDLIVARAVGQAPATWLSGVTAGQWAAITSTAINNALTAVRTALNLTALNSVNPLTDTFTAVSGNTIDNILEALKTALTNAGLAYATLLANIASNTTLPVNFQTALSTAYSALGTVTVGGSNSGSSCLTFQGGSVTGSPYTNGQSVCFNASSTTLAFNSTSLTSPAPGVTVVGYSIYVFTDLAAGVAYEVVFQGNTLYEINVNNLLTATFYGQFS